MKTPGLRITPIYAEPVEGRDWHDVWGEMEEMGREAFEQGRRILAFKLCAEDWRLLRKRYDPNYDDVILIKLLGHEDQTMIREER